MSDLALKDNTPEVAVAALVEAAKRMAERKVVTFEEVKRVQGRKPMPGKMREPFIVEIANEAFGKYIAAVRENPVIVACESEATQRGVTPWVSVESIIKSIEENTEYRCSSGMIRTTCEQSGLLVYKKTRYEKHDSVRVRFSAEAARLIERLKAYYSQANYDLQQVRARISIRQLGLVGVKGLRWETYKWGNELRFEFNGDGIDRLVEEAHASLESTVAPPEPEMVDLLRAHTIAKLRVQAMQEYKEAKPEPDEVVNEVPDELL